jgi:hypothetical protein
MTASTMAMPAVNQGDNGTSASDTRTKATDRICCAAWAKTSGAKASKPVAAAKIRQTFENTPNLTSVIVDPWCCWKDERIQA